MKNLAEYLKRELALLDIDVDVSIRQRKHYIEVSCGEQRFFMGCNTNEKVALGRLNQFLRQNDIILIEDSKALQVFLDSINDAVDYWSKVDLKDAHYTKAEEDYQRCSGVAFSILTMIDGDSSTNDFATYNIMRGLDIINKDVALHEVIKFNPPGGNNDAK